MERRNNKWHHRNTKDCKKILWTTIWQQIDNLSEMDKFPEIYNFPKLSQEESENLNRQITPSETEVIKKLPTNKSPQTVSFICDLKQTSKKSWHLSSNYVKKFKRSKHLFYEASIILIPKPDKDKTRKRNLWANILEEHRYWILT